MSAVLDTCALPVATPVNHPQRERMIQRLIARFDGQFLGQPAWPGTGVAWRCRVCGGRVDITARLAPAEGEADVSPGIVIGSIGRCRTDGCLDWRH